MSNTKYAMSVDHYWKRIKEETEEWCKNCRKFQPVGHVLTCYKKMSDNKEAIDLPSYLMVCLCDLHENDVVYDERLGQYEICNKHKAAKLESLAKFNCGLMFARKDENGNYQMEPIKQI